MVRGSKIRCCVGMARDYFYVYAFIDGRGWESVGLYDNREAAEAHQKRIEERAVARLYQGETE